jgi:3-oxoacyl-[acyl-carrier protein] reductase
MLHIDLSGNLAVVTGATGELGRVIVRTLAQCGADVAIHYWRNQSQAEALAADIEPYGVRGVTVQADVTNLESVLTMRDTVVRALGAPQILVNNAVIQYQPWTGVLDQAPEDYESQFRSVCCITSLWPKPLSQR